MPRLTQIHRRFLGYLAMAAAFVWVAIEFFGAELWVVLDYLLLTFAWVAGIGLMALVAVLVARGLRRILSSGGSKRF